MMAWNHKSLPFLFSTWTLESQSPLAGNVHCPAFAAASAAAAAAAAAAAG